MQVADLILPVFAVIVTGWLAGYLGYVSRDLADALIHFAYNVAMPALLIVTIAQEPARNLLEWRFLLAFGGGSLICFALVFLAVRLGWKRDLAASTIHGMTAAMTDTGLVALPILHSSTTGCRSDRRHRVRGGGDVSCDRHPPGRRGTRRAGGTARSVILVKQIVLNPMGL